MGSSTTCHSSLLGVALALPFALPLLPASQIRTYIIRIIDVHCLMYLTRGTEFTSLCFPHVYSGGSQEQVYVEICI